MRLSDWLAHAAELQLQALHIADAEAPADSVSCYHPELPAAIQILSTAAEARRRSGEPLWRTEPPHCLIVADGLDTAPWQALAAQFGISCLHAGAPAHQLLWRLRAELAERTAPRQTLHGTMVEVLGLGVLLRGPSGTGKSELALELVAAGHRLVADDVVELLRHHPDALLARCPPPLAGFLEVRGLGILDLRAMYGGAAIAAATRLDLVLLLDTAGARASADERLHGRRCEVGFLDVMVPQIVLPSRLRHNAVMVEAACRDHWLRRSGYVASQRLADAQTRLAAGDDVR